MIIGRGISCYFSRLRKQKGWNSLYLLALIFTKLLQVFKPLSFKLRYSQWGKWRYLCIVLHAYSKKAAYMFILKATVACALYARCTNDTFYIQRFRLSCIFTTRWHYLSFYLARKNKTILNNNNNNGGERGAGGAGGDWNPPCLFWSLW